MPRNWVKLAESSAIHEESDFKSASYQLLCAQVLYESDQAQRVAYRLIADHRTEFKEAFQLFGMDLVFDDASRYVAAIPEGGRKAILPLTESLLVLVLRKLYHEQASRGALEDGGVAIVSIDELRSAYLASTRRELPTSVGDLGALVDQMQRFGIARQIESETDSVQPFDVAVLPGIQTLVNEAALMKLSAHHEAAAALARIRNGAAASGDTSDASESVR